MSQIIEIRLDRMETPITVENPAFPELRSAPRSIAERPWKVACLRNGTTSGAPVVTLMLELPDGSVVYTEVTVRNFLMLAGAVRGWNASLPPDDRVSE